MKSLQDLSKIILFFHLNTFRKLDEEDSLEQLKEHDTDKDGKVTWKEYISKQYGYNPEDMEDFKHRDQEDLEDFNKVKKVSIQDNSLLIGILYPLVAVYSFYFAFKLVGYFNAFII